MRLMNEPLKVTAMSSSVASLVCRVERRTTVQKSVSGKFVLYIFVQFKKELIAVYVITSTWSRGMIHP